MKKSIFLSSLAVGLLFAAGAQAASNLTGTLSDSVSVTPVDCTLLSSDVAVKMSKGTAGSFACSEPLNSIVVSVCSSSGANKTRTETCSWNTTTDPTTGATTTTVNFDACGATPPNPIPTPAPTASITGRVTYAGTSSGGKVAPFNIGTTCDAAATRAINLWPAQ